MICPQTKAQCEYNCDFRIQNKCTWQPPDTTIGGDPCIVDLGGGATYDLREPDMAEIERLVDAYGKQQYELGHAIGSRASFATGAEFERAALLSAIQKLLA